MTTVYISIGTPKTGTSALQDFLRRNDDKLQEQGYAYPLLKLGIEGYYRDRNGQFLVYESTKVAKEYKKEHEAKVREAAYRQLGEAAKKHPNLILSDEQIWYRSRSRKHFWEDLLENFQKINCNVKVVVYLRRQDLLIQSMWNQCVKMFRRLPLTFEECMEKDYFRYFPMDYYDNLKYMEQYLGKENIIVRPYERGMFEGETQDVISDFLKHVGVAWKNDFEWASNVRNLGLEGNYIEIKRMINQVPEYRAVKRDFLSRPVLYGSTHITETGGHTKTGMFTYEQQAAYLAQFEESNRKVAEEYLGRKPKEPLFYEPIKALPQWSLQEDTMHRDIIVVMTEAFSDQEKRIAELEQEMKETKMQLENMYRCRFFRIYRKIAGIFGKR